MSDALSDQITTLVDQITAPIREDAPCGDDATYDDDFQDVKNAVDELSTASDDFDFDVIASKSLNLLTTTTKDLRVGVYFVLGKTQVQGIEGLAVGLAGLRALMETFWDDMHPAKRRAAARRNALQFVADRLTPWMERQSFGLTDTEALHRARSDLKAIQAFSTEALGENAPALSGLAAAFDRIVTRLEKRAETQSPSASSTTEATSPSKPVRPGDGAPGSTPSGSMPSPPSPSIPLQASPDGLSFGDAARSVVAIAAALRSKDATRPEPYQLLRVMRWGVFRSEPPSDGDGVTELPPPDDEMRRALPTILERGAFETVVEEGETAFQAGTFHCWLDLQRYLAQALGDLGPSYAEVRTVIQRETAALVRRLPGLPRLSFKDGTPFASPETVAWIETLGDASDTSSRGIEAREGDASDVSVLASLFDEARTVLADADLDAALDVLTDAVTDDASGQARFLRRLYAARLCLDGGKPEVARPMLEALDRAVDAHGLATWNPDLALSVWTRLYTCYRRLPDDAGTNGVALDDAAARIYAKICELDPQTALRLSA